VKEKTTFIQRYHKRDRKEAKRHKRLMSKIQKAGVLTRVGDILSAKSWNKRFGMTARLRTQN
jgi:hypothetical protein